MAKMITCKACKSQMASNAKACPNCGAKNKKPILTRVWFWLFVIIAIVIIGASSGANKSSKSISSTGTVNTTSVTAAPVEAIKVTAAELMKAYDNNEVKADTQYKGKLLTVKGKVDDISVTLGMTNVTVGTGAEFELGIICYFDDSEKDSIALLNKGDSISITGTCEGKALSVSMKECSIN